METIHDNVVAGVNKSKLNIYPPYVWYGGFYPLYFWYPPTYGSAAWYNYTANLGAVLRSMAHTVALEVGLPTTREQEHLLAGALSMGHTDPAGLHKHGIRAQEPGTTSTARDTESENSKRRSIYPR